MIFMPQVLRQMAISAGAGGKRPRPKREARAKMGTEGEDVVAKEDGGIKLRLPGRFGAGTVKGAAWAVRHFFHIYGDTIRAYQNKGAML